MKEDYKYILQIGDGYQIPTATEIAEIIEKLKENDIAVTSYPIQLYRIPKKALKQNVVTELNVRRNSESKKEQ